ncbi:MAG: BMP family ABC transporter substrate-binding protein [Chloroflexi bacterium]|nr:BMP family ABC transporter substrate-binding protein [Chloroflexota bacterium]MBE3119653.1 BMP family ABC transporter substrate-binding protein [Candidatus Atribacteria bacterium]
MKKLYPVVVVLLAAVLLLSACGPKAINCSDAETFCVGEVTDMGGVDDKSFNASAWLGTQNAIDDKLIASGKYLESNAQADYAGNIQQFLSENTDLIITVGFLLGVDTAKAAVANPNTSFAIVDYAYPDCWPGAVVGTDCGSDVDLPNVRGLMFQTDQAAFLAGYLAAGMTVTGKVGTFGGIPIPTVTIFMKGFQAGVKYYNQQKNAQVEVVGWNDATGEGLFTGNFDSTDDGRAFAQSLMQEGVDIIMPVAGPVGLGSAAICLETGGCKIIGVDNDWFESASEYKSVILSSVMKKIDAAVYKTIQDYVAGNFTGGTVTYTIADGGVDLAPYHEFDSAVPQTLKDEITQIKQQLIAGTLTVDAVLALP